MSAQHLNWSESDARAHQQRMAGTLYRATELNKAIKRRPSLHTPKPLLENTWERDYWQHLQTEAPCFAWIKPKPFRLRLNSGQFYTPDFMGQLINGRLCAHEVKGHFRPQDKARFKQAIAEYPTIMFVLVRKTPTGWDFEEFNTPNE